MVTLEELERSGRRLTLAKMKSALGSRRQLRDMVLELANLQDGSHEVFWKRFQGDYEAEDLRAISFTAPKGLRIYEHRDNLRKIWVHDPATADVISGWVKEANKRGPYHTIVLTNARGRSVFVAPTYSILPLSLALTANDLLPRMAVCGNPQCPNPYFLKGRKTQRFCDRPACCAFGQREHKRNWWNEHGAEWKRKRTIGKRRKRKGDKA